jgi:hypothetical protein
VMKMKKCVNQWMCKHFSCAFSDYDLRGKFSEISRFFSNWMEVRKKISYQAWYHSRCCIVATEL